MTTEITITEASKLWDKSIPHLRALINRGILPAGRKDGKNRYLPMEECINILEGHEPGTHWKTRKSGNLDWSSII